MSMARKVQQQYYTRGREGVFRTNEGLDTVAKSSNLDNNFIKKTLHPFCTYFPPAELSQRGEKDVQKYPESITVFHSDNGDMVIGRAMYLAADFTGQRETMFVHNYIVPRELKEAYIVDPIAIFHNNQFASHYDHALGKELPELDRLPYDTNASYSGQQELLTKLKINEKIFKQLMRATILSIASNKKVFISLDVDISESSYYAKRLVEVIYYSLPYELRRHFGFSTYQNVPQAKKYINVMFVEKDSFRQADRSIDKEFIFDFVNERYLNVDVVEEDNHYLNLIWACLTYPDVNKSYFQFAEEAIQDLDSNKTLAYATYSQLGAIFRVEKGTFDPYAKNKEGMLNSILSFVNEQNFAKKTKLLTLFNKLVQQEKNELLSGSVLSVAYIKELLVYCQYVEKDYIHSYISVIALSLYNNRKTGKDGSYTKQVLLQLQDRPHLFQELMEHLCGSHEYENIAEELIIERAASIVTVKALNEEINYWRKLSPNIITRFFFIEQINLTVINLLKKDKAYISRGNEILHLLHKIVEQDNRYEQFSEQIIQTVLNQVFNSIKLGALKLQDIDELKSIMQQEKKQVNTILTNNRELQQLQSELELAFSILHSSHRNSDDFYEDLDELSPRSFESVQLLFKNIIKDNPSKRLFSLVKYAFYIQGNGNYRNRNDYEYRYDELLIFVDHLTNGKEQVIDFLMFDSELIGSSKKYQKYVRSYFSKKNNKVLKDSTVKKKMLTVRSKKFKEFIKELSLEQSNGFVRFLHKYRKMIALGAAIVFVMAIIGLVLLFMFKDNGPVVNDPLPTLEPSPTPTIEQTPLPTSTTDPIDGSNGLTPETSGLPGNSPLPEVSGSTDSTGVDNTEDNSEEPISEPTPVTSTESVDDAINEANNP